MDESMSRFSRRRSAVRAVHWLVVVLSLGLVTHEARADLPISVAPSVAVGEGEACAVLGSGAVVCWGFAARVPTRVPGIDDAVQVVMGDEHRCVLRRSGTVACWGSNEFGQLGNDLPGLAYSPLEVQGLSEVRELSAGGMTTCARLASGRVACWGLGIIPGDDGARVPWPRATEIPGIDDAVHLAVASDFACAVCGSGALVCWGRSPFETDASHGGPVVVPGVEDARAVALTAQSYDFTVPPARVSRHRGRAEAAGPALVSVSHGCVLRGAGEVWCFGNNMFGQLGDGTRSPRPGVLVRARGITGATQLAVGGAQSCAHDGPMRLRCWGMVGRVPALPSPVDGIAPSPIDVFLPFAGPGAVVEIGENGGLAVFAGPESTCGVRTDGRVVCWGRALEPTGLALQPPPAPPSNAPNAF